MDYSSFTVKELDQELRRRKLPRSGSKGQKIERVIQDETESKRVPNKVKSKSRHHTPVRKDTEGTSRSLPPFSASESPIAQLLKSKSSASDGLTRSPPVPQSASSKRSSSMKKSPVNQTPSTKKSPVNRTPSSQKLPVDQTSSTKKSPVNRTPSSQKLPIDQTSSTKKSPVNRTPSTKKSPVNQTSAMKQTPSTKKSPINWTPSTTKSQSSSSTQSKASAKRRDKTPTPRSVPETDALDDPDAPASTSMFLAKLDSIVVLAFCFLVLLLWFDILLQLGILSAIEERVIQLISEAPTKQPSVELHQ